MVKPAELRQFLANPETAPKGAVSARPDEDGQTWPSWRYGPNGEAEVFDAQGDVPKGWKDHPGAFASKDKGKPEFDM